MNNFKKFLLLVALMCASEAQTHYTNTNSFTMNVGPTFNFARYKFGNLSKTEGYLAGIHADLAYKHCNKFSTKLRFDGRWNAGFVAGENDRKVKISDYRPELDFGYTILLGACENIKCIPFIGIGYYFLRTRFTAENVIRNYYNLYIPVGAKVTWHAVENCFAIGLGAEYRIDAQSLFKQELPNLPSTSKIKLNRTHGLLVEMPMTWFHETCHDFDWHTKVVPYFDWNKFGRAQEVNQNNIPVDTPRVQQWYLGLHVDVGVHF